MEPGYQIKSTEEFITEQNLKKAICLADIYITLPELDANHLQMILTNFKLPELCQLLNDRNGFKKYMDDMAEKAKACTEMASAMDELYKKAFDQSGRVSDPIDHISEVFEGLSGRDKQRVCANLLDKQEFFMDAYSGIMAKLNDALKGRNDLDGNLRKN